MSITEIGRRLKKARLDAGFTQKEVADRLGITYQAISNYERGTNRVDTDTLTQLCKIYGILISDLLTTPAWTDEMLQAYRDAKSRDEKDHYIKLWGTPAELIEEENNRREPDMHPLSPDDEMILHKYHRGTLLPDMTKDEVDLISKFRQLDDLHKNIALGLLDSLIKSQPGEKAVPTPKQA